MKSKSAGGRAASTRRGPHNRVASERRSRAESAPGGSATVGTHRRSPEIIDAAARVFATLGYYGATTQDIADVLGIRQASLYYYLPSKEVALEIVCTHGVEDFYKAAKAIAAGPGTAREKLISLVRAHITPVVDRGDFVRVFLTQRQFLPQASRRRVGKWSRAIEQLFEAVVRDGVRGGEFRADADPRLTTLALLGMANAVAGWYSKEQASIERIGNEFAALILRGLAADPPRKGERADRST
jgi:TetR/AcrR family transcriptional regulator, cholesterol catabolism regulator